MAISIKTSEDIEKMRVAGRLAAEVLEMIEPYYKGFPEQSTPVFNFCLFINERQGIRLRYYKRSC